MKSSQFLKEGFVEDAHNVHQDHEVQMAREELYHSAESALRLHKLLRNVSEEHGLEGWVSAKITLANDYLKTVLEYMEYHLMTDASGEGNMSAEPVAEAQLDELSPQTVSNYVKTTIDKNQDRQAGLTMAMKRYPHLNLIKPDWVDINNVDNLTRLLQQIRWKMNKGTASRDERFAHEEIENLIKSKQDVTEDTSAGNVATVNNPTPKNKAKTGTLFGGTYQQPKAKAKK